MDFKEIKNIRKYKKLTLEPKKTFFLLVEIISISSNNVEL